MKLITEEEFPEYKRFYPTKEKLKKLVGCRVLYVDRICPHRGYYHIEGGIINKVRYSIVYLNDHNKDFDIRDLKDIVYNIKDYKEEL